MSNTTILLLLYVATWWKVANNYMFRPQRPSSGCTQLERGAECNMQQQSKSKSQKSQKTKLKTKHKNKTKLENQNQNPKANPPKNLKNLKT